MEDIIITESFIEEETPSFDHIERKQFDSLDVLELRVEAEGIAQETAINQLLCYANLKKNLEFDLPHQSEGALRILRDMNGTALLADEVGLGKTITAGIILKECITRGFVKKALILTPPSLVDQWVAELKEKFELSFKIMERESDWGTADFSIASIDRVKIFNKDANKFRHEKAHEICWDLLIVDEAHKLKEKKTVRWEFVDRMQKKRFLILTATPFQNDLLELYNLLHLLKRGHLGTLREFKKTFLFRGNKRYPLNPKDLKLRLDEVMVRRKRSDTIVQYKRRIPRTVAVDLSPEEYALYSDLCDLLKTKYFAANGSELNGRLIVFALLPKVTSSSRAAIESLARIVGEEKYHEKTRALARGLLERYKGLARDSKVEKLVEIVADVLAENKDEKILIYTRHPTTLKYLVEKLKGFDVSIVEFTGGLDREEKTRRIKEFKEHAQIMISTETGSEGLNFQFCSVLINYDLPWNPMAVEQRIGRLDRIGQKKDMQIYSLATKRTMEEHVVDLIINKMCCVGLVIGELPIILFNLGLDGTGKYGMHKVEEMLMNAFLDSKNNLDRFAADVDKIGAFIEQGIDEYYAAQANARKILDDDGTKGTN